MSKRYLIITLSLFISLGAFGHSAGALDCVPDNICVPEQGTGHSAGHGANCFCGLWNTPSNRSCRLENLLETFQSAFVPPASKRTALLVHGLPAVRWDRIPRLDHRAYLPQRLSKTDSPLSYPIYLQTLSLLC